MGIHNGYKTTELGEIPQEWYIVKQGDVATFYNGRAYKISEWENIGTPVIRLQNLTGRGDEYYYSTLELPEHQYANKGDLLYMWSATFGPHIWKGDKAIYHYHIWKVDCKKGLLEKMYMYYLLYQTTEGMKSQTHGSTMMHVTKEIMEKMEIPLPPLAEQQCIAEILSSNDALITKIDALIEKTKEVKQGLMQELLTKGIGHTEFKDSELGRIPKEWEVTPLREVFRLKSGEFLPQSKIVAGAFPVYGGNGITAYHNEYLFEDSKLIIGRVGAKCGCVYLSEPYSWITDNALYIGVKIKEYLDSFMYYVLCKTNLNSYANQSAQPVISGQKIYEICVALPSYEEQEKIVSILSNIDEKIEALAKRKQQLEEIKQGLMQDLLTGRVRVNVN